MLTYKLCNFKFNAIQVEKFHEIALKTIRFLNILKQF